MSEDIYTQFGIDKSKLKRDYITNPLKRGEIPFKEDIEYLYIELNIVKTVKDVTSNTKYDSTNTNRATNLEIAAGKINGVVLEPGEVFSFNKVVGERTAKSGFKEAVIYADGELDYGLGGGICQISSNLYYTVLLANLPALPETFKTSMSDNLLEGGPLTRLVKIRLLAQVFTPSVNADVTTKVDIILFSKRRIISFLIYRGNGAI